MKKNLRKQLLHVYGEWEIVHLLLVAVSWSRRIPSITIPLRNSSSQIDSTHSESQLISISFFAAFFWAYVRLERARFLPAMDLDLEGKNAAVGLVFELGRSSDWGNVRGRRSKWSAWGKCAASSGIYTPCPASSHSRVFLVTMPAHPSESSAGAYWAV